MSRTLYYGDNLTVLREMPSESVDLIYLDPPFNSNADYNVIFREQSGDGPGAQIRAFNDTWTWGIEAATTLQELICVHGELAEYLDFTVKRLGHNSMSAYLVMMAPRLVELHRLLKPTGSLYLHCDPTASHYLKMLLDIVFGPRLFRNEITWKRTSAHSSANKFGPVHDTILYYAKGAAPVWRTPRMAYEREYLDKYYRFDDGDGRLYWRADLCAAGTRNGRSGMPWRGFDPTAKGMHWKFKIETLDELDDEGRIYWPKGGAGFPQYKRYRDELKGKAVGDLWDDIDRINPQAKERLGYPTQKPIALLERIVQASSNPGDVVLDPFCGCGTAVAAAEQLGRSWVGIDITHLAIGLISNRLLVDHGLERGKDFEVIGTPLDVPSAQALFDEQPDGPYQFQFWVNGLIGAQSYGAGATGRGKKGGDTGIDGRIYFRTPGGESVEKVIVSVKGGHQLNPGMVRELESVVRRESAAMGVFVSLHEVTSGMRQEAARFGLYEYGSDCIPRIQLLTVAELLEGRRPWIPAGSVNVSMDAKPAKRLAKAVKTNDQQRLYDAPAGR